MITPEEMILRLRSEMNALINHNKDVWLDAPLTSTAWDGDAFSTVGTKTLLDLSAVFGCPDNVSAVLLRVQARDSASSADTDGWVALSPDSSGTAYSLVCRCAGLTNNFWADKTEWIKTDPDGNLWYVLGASGASTLDVYIEIWGYKQK